MEQLNFDKDLPAIWLVFGGSYLTHNNAPRKTPDGREQSLIKLLCSFLSSELSSSQGEKQYGPVLVHLTAVHNLLKLWSQDLDLIYQIRDGSGICWSLVVQMARMLLQRIKTFENCTIIPNGLLLAQHTHNIIKRIDGCHDNVNLAILKKQNDHIDWVQVNPGSVYHQDCPSLAGSTNNAFFEMTDIKYSDITEELLSLLVGLKTIHPGENFYYKEVSLYECLLVFLNGKTVFQTNSDEDFIASSPISPVHIWQVVDQSFRYLLRHFIGDAYHIVYQRLLTNFKLFLMEKVFAAYQNNKTQECHYLLQEMCCSVAQQVVDHGDEKQKAVASNLIDQAKTAIREHCGQQELQMRQECQLRGALVSSLSFVAPRINNYGPSSNSAKWPILKVEPVLVKPSFQDDVLDYLKQFKVTFMDKMMNLNNLNEVALLTYSIEVFFIDYLAKTNILQTSAHSLFSSDDTALANALIELAEIYYSCQAQLINRFLSNLTYQPVFYAKNVIIQFFVYAAVAALNFRDECTGPLLTTHNLSDAVSDSLSFHAIIPHLVIDDVEWLRVVFTMRRFFKLEEKKRDLFSYKKFQGNNFTFKIENYAETNDIDVAFAFKLLQRDPEAYSRFNYDHRLLNDEQFNRKWQTLAYTDKYLPPIYHLLTKVAHFAKVSLTGLSPGQSSNSTKGIWAFSNSSYSRRIFTHQVEYKVCYLSSVSFQVNCCGISTVPSSEQLTSYLLKASPLNNAYQRLIIRKENIGKPQNHFLENEIIASQDEKPNTMDNIKYMQLGFLQSEAQIKLERLYVALKEQQLDFTCEQENVLIQQTLFEISIIMKLNHGVCTLLEWTVIHNPTLIHKLGVLCVEKALAMQHRLTQHNAIGNILETVLRLLSFYPSAQIDEFIKGISDIYHMLKELLVQPPTNLSDHTLLHLDAYLIISVQGAPHLLETETLTVLKAFVHIQNYKAKGVELDNRMLLRVYKASFTLSLRIETNLEQNPTLLNDLMITVIPQWDQASLWQKSEDGLLYTCNDHAIKPLLGGIYFQNQPVVGLPTTITGHCVFREYLGRVSFTVIPSSREIDNNQQVPCFLSVDHKQQTRLTLIQDALLIEEFINGDYQLYIPSQELLGHSNYPRLLYRSPHNGETFRHWLDKNEKILIKDKKRQIIYRWDLNSNFVLSSQHQGYVVPLDHVQGSAFKSWMNRVESPGWTEIIAQPNSDGSIRIESLHFPRLGLHFDLKEGKFHSKQIHGYVLAEQQHINTLHGFLNYFVLEKQEPNSTRRLTKVVIPHRRVTPSGSFMVNTAIADHTGVKTPAYFVYDYDPKITLLKASHTRAQLYLALLYYCSASLDEHDVSECNAYHLARENLEACWKDQPFDNVELDIINQLLSPEAMRDFHKNRIAVYLKVLSLLKSSLRLEFLYTDEAAVQSKRKSHELLSKCWGFLPFLRSLYLQNKSTIFGRLRLNSEEEKDVSISQSLQVVLSATTKKSYKDHYERLFSREALNSTFFIQIFEEYLVEFCLEHENKRINFLSGFDGILLDRFRLNNFITLYNLAKSSTVTLIKYCYLLHHMVFRAKYNHPRFPTKMAMMLARALLLVAENPFSFPELPRWFGKSKLSVILFNRRIIKEDLLKAFPDFCWIKPKKFDTQKEEDEAMKLAVMAYNRENDQIWSYFSSYDLNRHGIPNYLPNDPNYFTLCYEPYVRFLDSVRRDVVRALYLEAAYNEAMYQLFVTVLQRCDHQKYGSTMGWRITPFIDNRITQTIMTERFPAPTPEPVSWEKWAIPQKPLIAVDKFFTIVPQLVRNTVFLFEAQLGKPDNKYQRQFYKELKDSWSAYHNETEFRYSWLNTECMSKLEQVLQGKYDQFCEKATQSWGSIEKQLEQRPNSESDNYFALRWHSGQVSHYSKGDILRLIVEPHKLASYNPNCVKKHDSIIQSLLHYIICEINATKIVRVLALIDQYKQAESEEEQFSILQGLVKSLQENIDPASFRYPHWFLFQLENDIIVRDNQRELIGAMLNQTEKAMYQLNMGEGKSSVILPLLCNNLANGDQILRINVLSALLTTTKNFLRQRFSGLIKKRVYTLPFHRDTDISSGHLTLIFQTLQTCKESQHILLVTPEHRLCLQLKVRELMLENQQQIGATNIFNWQTYRNRVACKTDEVYKDLTETEREQLLAKQDKRLQTCLLNEKYINSSNTILKVPPRGQGRKAFAQFKETINDRTFREWTCLKAAYRELLYNASVGHEDSSGKLTLLDKINALTAIDLLDESDEILRHGTELNYTIGDKHMFAGGELRWQIPQFFIKAIFCDPEIRDVIIAGIADGFTVLNVHYSPKGGVPFVQLLDKTYFEDCIKPLLIEKFFSKNLPTFQKYYMNADNPVIKGKFSSLRDYIAGQLPLNTEKKIGAFLADKGQLKDKLLIAKGWLSHGILFHVFNAKYRVQYGLNLYVEGQIPKPIAIPFMGKDLPSPRSEFSHPDVMLGFTIISYLYQGLDQQQLKETLMRLKKKYSHKIADALLKKWADASREWIQSQTDTFPPIMLTSLRNLDLADEQCVEKVHQYLSGNHLAIEFFVDQFVLLQEAMQYLYKISANAHSLVGYNAALGFSGTDDRKITMPFEIKSVRSATQQGTNGKLLSVLTQERNSRYYSLQVEDTNSLLEDLCNFVANKPQVHASIDAGALVTGLTNHEVAVFLLTNLPPNFLGVLYFSDEGNSLTVLTRDNKTILLQDCYLDKQNLFAYLDDVHTRGTDIKLPLNCHAILTISMGMQKDKLMQAAMRLRQLAQKQSVSLWGMQAVTLAIARDNSIEADRINSFEVIKWVTKNTIDHINADLFPVGVRKMNFQFLKTAEAWLKDAPTTLDSLVQHCQEKELFSLEEFYELSPQRQDLADRLYFLVAGRIRAFWQEIEEELESKQLTHSAFYEKIFNQFNKPNFRRLLDTICNEFAVYLGTGLIHSSLDDDEEKEVEVEIIQEQEVLIKIEKREPYSEQEWNVRLILQQNFVTLAEEKSILMPLKTIRHFIQMPVNLKNIIWHPNIYMTSNFINSVQSRGNETFDNYLRPVDVMLVHKLSGETKIVLLSGREAAWIKTTCYEELDDNNLLINLYDVDGPTQLPTDCAVSKQDQKLLTIVKLFAGECHYPTEVLRLSQRVGRLYSDYFTRLNTSINDDCLQKLYGTLIEEGYLEFSGILTKKLLDVFNKVKSGESPTLELTGICQPHCELASKKLYQIFTKLVIQPSSSLKENHSTLHQWVGTRGRLKEYLGSELESIFNAELELKYCQ